VRDQDQRQTAKDLLKATIREDTSILISETGSTGDAWERMLEGPAGDILVDMILDRAQENELIEISERIQDDIAAARAERKAGTRITIICDDAPPKGWAWQ
jgi:DNA invertase Pin-like site-specific DNA recombinase